MVEGDGNSSRQLSLVLVVAKSSMLLIVSKMSSETSEAYKTHSRTQESRGSDLYLDDTDNT
jgi:hypothetical protein